MPKFQRPRWKIDVMAAHIAQRSAAKRPPPAPVERNVIRTIVSFGSRTQPEIPMKRRRDRRRFGRSFSSVLPAYPNVDLLYLANSPALDRSEEHTSELQS